MLVADLPPTELRQRLAGPGLKIQLDPFVVQARIDGPPAIYQQLRSLYQHALAPDDAIAHFHAGLQLPNGPRRWLKPKVQFFDDLSPPFTPLPAVQAFPMFEWGINWCVANQANHYLMLHCGALERHGQVALFPAWPTHGKTTLCAGLMLSGWRLFSDEFGLLRPGTATVVPFPRLMPLKNASIEVIRRFAAHARLGPVFYNTRKGDVAHLQPDDASVQNSDKTAPARWLIFPRWHAKATLKLTPMAQSRAFLLLATNAFNYEVLGAAAFRTVDQLVRECACYSLQYSNLHEAVAALNDLVDQQAD